LISFEEFDNLVVLEYNKHFKPLLLSIKMSLESDKEIRLKKYIEENNDCKTGNFFKTEYKGELIPLEIHRLPIDLLTYNLENGRFAADKLAEEARLKRKLNLEEGEDVEKIKKLLLERRPDETKQLMDDLKRIGQVNPGIITVAGNVINANRRMAILSELKEKTGDEKYGYLSVGILPKGADAKDIWMAESKIQFGQEFKVNYTAVNKLLKIRDAIQNRDMEEKEVANALSMNIEDLKKELARLGIIERYLDYIGKSKEYTYVDEEGIHEHFIDLQNNLEGSHDDFSNVEEQVKFINIHFELIKADSPHLFIRDLKRIKKNNETKDNTFSIFDKLKNKEINLKDFKSEIEDIINFDKERSKGEPKRLLQGAYRLLSEFNKRYNQKLCFPEEKIFNYIEEIVKQIKEKS